MTTDVAEMREAIAPTYAMDCNVCQTEPAAKLACTDSALVSPDSVTLSSPQKDVLSMFTFC
jgi:hypothetical protein